MLYYRAQVRSQVYQNILFSSTLAFISPLTQRPGSANPQGPNRAAEVKPPPTAGTLIEFPVWRNGAAAADELIK